MECHEHHPSTANNSRELVKNKRIRNHPHKEIVVHGISSTL